MASNIQIEIAADVQKAVQGIEAVVQRLDKMQKETEESKKSFFQTVHQYSIIILPYFFLLLHIYHLLYLRIMRLIVISCRLRDRKIYIALLI